MNVNLFLFKEDGSSKSFALPSSVTVIGRQRGCDLCIPMMVISRRHCELNTDGGKLRVRDLGTRNGTFLNGERVDESDVNPGDIIGVGPMSFIVQINGNPMHVEAPMDPSLVQMEKPQYREPVSSYTETLNGTESFNDDGFSVAEAELAESIEEMVPENEGG